MSGNDCASVFLRNQGFWLGLLALGGLGLGGCGTKYTCGPNFQQVGAQCYCPEEAGFTLGGANGLECIPAAVETDIKAGKDAKDAGAKDVGEPVDDLGEGDAPGTEEDSGGEPELPLDTGGGSSSKSVGAPCTDNIDCIGGLQCYNWPKGYCTDSPCSDIGTPCPGASQCWAADATAAKMCVKTCDSVADCRKDDGYGCKRMTTTYGGVDANLCTVSGPSAVGMGCLKALDCAGDNVCLTDMAGGYCARIGCSPTDPCDPGSACVMRNGKFTCLKTCTADPDCAIATKQARKCVAKSDVKKNAVQVCLDSSKAAPVGSACVADLDCDSKFCSIFAKGTCATGGAVCLTNSQCGSSQPCNIPKDGSQDKGTCSAACDTKKNCPTGGFCVEAGNTGAGSCAAKCMGPGDDASCGGVPGLMCLYGQPLVTPTGVTQPGYACAPRPAGSAGADCTESADCDKPTTCMVNTQNNGGFCATSCGPPTNTPCPFGTVCTEMGFSLCLRMCTLDLDCPPLFACKLNPQAGTKVCQLP